jgi:hypothetical protein
MAADTQVYTISGEITFLEKRRLRSSREEGICEEAGREGRAAIGRPLAIKEALHHHALHLQA